MKKNFDDDLFFQNFEKIGKCKYGEKYCIQDRDFVILQKLKIYFGRDVDAALKNNIDLHKGLLLSGPIGVGKTSLMHIFRESLQENYRFLIKPCSEVSFEFINEGANVIFRYGRNSFKDSNREPRTICFDDLGLEPSTSFFSNKANIMREIILSRYYYFQSHKMITHFTTNLGASDIEKRYGKEVRSRIREMCNVISFEKTTPDKRE